ncbi:MAG TPA: glycosyl hydrolase family 65 protein [Candidatus Dormibacteraeota bacterium]|nr:glycosyl hydrolase family 65 protein [Candidatus Dormibacteraeota bacterium]
MSAFTVLLLTDSFVHGSEPFQILHPDSFRHHIERFNSMAPETITNAISNGQSFSWLENNVPLFECPDKDVEEIYYFRWWSFRKHLVKTPRGFVITEFLAPMKHAGPSNTISCAAGFHIAEARWLRNSSYANDYATFWFRRDDGKPQGHFHRYSSWLPAAIYDKYLVDANRAFLTNLLDDFVVDYRAWETERGLTNGLFFQFDVWDGMEESISGSRTAKNIRPTINSYMFGNARAIAETARAAGDFKTASEFDQKAARLRASVQKTLWNPEANFFEVLRPDGKFSDAREELGFIPWCFNIPSAGQEIAWSQLLDTNGFRAPFGLTTAEQRNPKFRSHGCCKCEWDGAVWPFATSQTLCAMGNLLRDYSQTVVSSRDYLDAFVTYVLGQHREGKPFIGEYLDEQTGEWLRFSPDRSSFYNHSVFADLIISGVVGFVPRSDETVEVNPLLPQKTWDWFCLDGVRYHNRELTILWDAKGARYNKGPGLTVLADGKVVAHSAGLGRLTGKLP